MIQKYSSKNTSINTINKVYKKYTFPKGTRLLDYGGGKYNLNKEYLKQQGVNCYIYDKYNRSQEENTRALSEFEKNKADVIVCSNVLNVIYEEHIIRDILSSICHYADEHTMILISIYEGDKSGHGRESKKGYQRNEKSSAYTSLIEEFFSITKHKQAIFECKKKGNNLL